jgi:hypothetical protein
MAAPDTQVAASMAHAVRERKRGRFTAKLLNEGVDCQNNHLFLKILFSHSFISKNNYLRKIEAMQART